MNSRLDLSEAEGIRELVRAQTSLQRQQALGLARGGLKQARQTHARERSCLGSIVLKVYAKKPKKMQT